MINLPSIRNSIIYNESALINRKPKSKSEIIEQNLEPILMEVVGDYNYNPPSYNYDPEEDRITLQVKTSLLTLKGDKLVPRKDILKNLTFIYPMKSHRAQFDITRTSQKIEGFDFRFKINHEADLFINLTGNGLQIKNCNFELMNTSSNTDVTTIYIRNKNNELFKDVKGFEKFLDQLFGKKGKNQFSGGFKKLRVLIEDLDVNDDLTDQLVYIDPKNNNDKNNAIIDWGDKMRKLTGNKMRINIKRPGNSKYTYFEWSSDSMEFMIEIL